MLIRFHRSFRVFLFFSVICVQVGAALDVAWLVKGAGNLATDLLAHTNELKIIRWGLEESDEGGKKKLKPHWDHISGEDAKKALVVGGILLAFARTLNGSIDYRYTPENNMYRQCGEGGSEEGNRYTGNVDKFGNPYRPPWAQAEYDAKNEQERRRRQEELDREYEEGKRRSIEEETQRLSDEKLRKEQQKRDQERAKERALKQEQEKKKRELENSRTMVLQLNSNDKNHPPIAHEITLNIPARQSIEFCGDPEVLNRKKKSDTPSIIYSDSIIPPFKQSPPIVPLALDLLHEEFKIQHPELLANEGLFRSLIEPYDAQFKQYLVGQAYDALCTPATSSQRHQIDAQERLIDSLEQLQKFTMQRNPEEALHYGQLASALDTKMFDDWVVLDRKISGAVLPSREMLFSDPVMDLQTDIDMAKILAKDSKRILKRSQELLVERGGKAIDNPVETATTIAVGAALSPRVLGGIIAWQLISNHKELWQDSKEFARLLRDDTLEGIAHLIAFCIEVAVLHKASTGTVSVGAPQLKKIKSMLGDCAAKASQEQSLALAAKARGIKIETPHADLLKGARDAAKLAAHEGNATGVTGTVSNTVGKDSVLIAQAESKAANVVEKTAFETAKQGGKHSGFYDQYIRKSTDEIHKGIQSIEKQITEHQSKISNPEQSIPNFKDLDYRQQEALINKKWPSDIKRQIEQKEILEGILKDRNG